MRSRRFAARSVPLTIGASLLLPAAAGCHAVDRAVRPWTGPSEATFNYWFAVGTVTLLLLAFMGWALFARRLPRSAEPATLAAGVGLLILWTFLLYLVPAIAAERVAPDVRTWDWERGEILSDPGGSGLQGEPRRGYELYVANNCQACHTLYLRPQDIGTGWAEGASADDVAATADYVYQPAPVLGTQRNGPDLSYIGRRIPDLQYHIEHLRDPRAFKPESIMPTYRYLSERDLRDLAAFLVSLGQPPAKLKAGDVSPQEGAAEGLSDAARLGRDLYRSEGCVGCHSLDGSANAGPTWQGLWGKTETIEGGTKVEVDEAYLVESILDPSAKVVEGFRPIMPSYQGRLTEEEIEAIIAFIKSLE